VLSLKQTVMPTFLSTSSNFMCVMNAATTIVELTWCSGAIYGTDYRYSIAS